MKLPDRVQNLSWEIDQIEGPIFYTYFMQIPNEGTLKSDFQRIKVPNYCLLVWNLLWGRKTCQNCSTSFTYRPLAGSPGVVGVGPHHVGVGAEELGGRPVDDGPVVESTIVPFSTWILRPAFINMSFPKGVNLPPWGKLCNLGVMFTPSFTPYQEGTLSSV
jgi:hypothetical protein